MRKKVRKLLECLLIIAVFIILGSINVSAANTSSVEAKINSLMNTYVGTYWTKDGKPSSNYQDSKYYYGWQCKGFANYVFNEIFGKGNIGSYDGNKYYIPNPQGAYEIGRIWNFSQDATGVVSELLKKGMPGDFIQVRRRGKDDGHSMIVVSVNNDGIKVFDCNSDGKCGVRSYDISWSSFTSKNIGLSLYHATNYPNTIMPDPSIAGTYWGNMSNTTVRPVVVINNPESIKSVRFAVWTTADQSDLKWYDANYNGQKEYFKDINNSDFKNKIYICHVYVYGCNGSVKAIEMERLDRNNYPKPSIKGAYWGSNTDTTFRPVVVINNPESIKSVRFAVWTTGDQSDLKWYDANYNGVREYFKDIRYSDLKNQKYFCHAYVYGKDGSTQSIALDTFDTYNAEGNFESAEGGIGSISIRGWAFDRSDPKESVYIHCYAKDSTGKATLLGGIKANLERPDVNAAYSVGNNHGFSEKFITSLSGTYTIEASAINIGGGKEVTFLGAKTVTIVQPTLYFDSCGGTKCASRKVVNGQKYGKLPVPVRSGYIFNGWYTAKEGGQKITEEKEVSLTDNKTLYGHWIKTCEHKNTELRNKKEATCTAEGYTGDTYCKDCGTKLQTGKAILKKAHTWDAGKITQEATCAKTGIKTYTCTVCKTTKTENVPATGNHKNTEFRNVREATCTAEGYTGDTYCKDCGTKLQTGKAIAKKSHTWDAGKITQEATCAKTGIKTYTCTVCKTTKTENVPATGNHKNTELRNVKEATCTEEGYTGDTYCKDCGSKIASGQKISKTEHTWNSGVITTSPTCVERGVKIYTCNICQTTRTEELPATGNHQNTELRNAKEATCTAEGYTGDIYCKDCGTKLQTGKAIAKKAHTWDAGIVTKTATCTESGVKTYTCTLCKATKTEEVPATGNHEHTELRDAREATCAEDGYTGDLYCKDCGTKLQTGKTIAKKAHTWDAGVITTPATCTEKGGKTYTCTSCGGTKTNELPSTGHKQKEVRNKKAATCMQSGYTGDTYCRDCGKKLSSGKAIAKLAHKWDTGVITQEATCTEAGIKTYTCTVCESTRIEELPANGHGETVTKFAKEATCKMEGYTGDLYCMDCGELLEEGSVIEKLPHQWDAGKITKKATTSTTGIRTYTCTKCGATKKETIPKVVPKKATPGKTVKDSATNGIYKVLADGLTVTFVRPAAKRATVRIPETVKVSGVTCKVTEISANAFKNDAVLKTVVIGKNVKTIGVNAFYGCKNLTKVSGGAALVTICDRAFSNCAALQGIVLPSTVKGIGKQAFYNCKKLRSITINTLSLTSKNVGAQAFTGTYAKAVVKVPAKKFAAYKSLLRAKGMNVNAVYSK